MNYLTFFVAILFYINGIGQIQYPNVIVIFCDDLGYGDLSTYGNPTIHTPNLDRMALEGQKWTQFYAADPVCTPSRAGLLTGRYPIRSGMTSKKRGVLFPDSAGGLPKSEMTLAELFKTRSYVTSAVGKWHLGHLPEHLPMNHGFDHYYGIPYSNDMNAKVGLWGNYEELINDPDYDWDYRNYDVPLMEDDQVIERPANQNTITQRYTDRSIEFIKANTHRPFFLYLAHSLPHIPLFASYGFRGRSKRGIYGDVIEEIDYGIGEILKTLQEEGIADNTLVVFTSDNGPWLRFKTHGGSAGPLRAGKGTTFEGGQRVPAIFWGPGIVRPGIIDTPGSTLDLFHTCSTLIGKKNRKDRKMDSYDLTPVLRRKEGSPREEFFYWAFGELHAVRSGPWKLHIKQRAPVHYGQVVEMDGVELYNLEKDISEKYNVAEANGEVVNELLMLIKEHLEHTSDALPDQLEAKIAE
ncbi:sulfatase family protein [Portibacter marinus]|uniref:sulfatase family protein n=1 Tax=Portibacter marinus TaxID=2898660 RepID=UPI001F3C3DAF|nr:sulfatase [Portibacter marinus]